MSRTVRKRSLASFSDGRDENNLAEFPVALLGDSVPTGQKTIEFEDTLDDWSTGHTIVRRVCITGSDKFGLPTAKDEEVLMGLIQLTRIANNFMSPEVWFVKRDVIEILGWQDRGWSYERIEESLHRWKGVSIHYWNAWRDNESGSWRDSAAVGIIEYFSLTDGRFRAPAQVPTRSGQSCFCWNKLFFQSFQAGYLKKLDFEVYRSLKGAAVKRAYRFLDKRFYHRDDWKFDLRQFACEKLGFSRAYTTGQLKERVRPVLGKLEQIGFIEPHKFAKGRPKVWTLSVTKRTQEKSKESDQVAVHPVERDLVKRGVKSKVAAALCRQFSVEYLVAKIQFVDWLLSKDDKRISKSIAGFLVDCIRKDYPLPVDYLRWLRRKFPKRQAAKNTTDDRFEATVAGPEAGKDPTDFILDAMPHGERQTLLQEAIARASPLERASLDRVRSRGSELCGELERSFLCKYLRARGDAPENNTPSCRETNDC
jgi:hypothetical protein